MRLKIQKKQIRYPLQELSLEGHLLVYKINQFSDSSQCQRLKSYLRKFASRIQRTLIDLRDNPGGYIEVATCIADALLPSGKTIYSAKRLVTDMRSPESYSGEWSNYSGSPSILNQEFFLFLNQRSASASELLASAIKNNADTIIFGEKSFGKGAIQEQMDRFEQFDYLGKNSDISLFMTKKLLFGPDGKTFHGVGIEPDLNINLKKKPLGGPKCWRESYNLTKETYLREDRAELHTGLDFYRMRLGDYLSCKNLI